MGMEGFDKSKMRMSPEEKAKLSDVERATQNSREATIDDAHQRFSERPVKGAPYAGTVEKAQEEVVGEIVKDAQAENLQRAQEEENRVQKSMDINNMSPKDKEALTVAQRKVEDAYHLREKGKN